MNRILIVLTGLLLCLSIHLLPADSQQDTTEAQISRLIESAESSYWFGINERGNMQAFRQGLELLDRAEKLLRDQEMQPEVKSGLKRRLEALRSDLTEQADMAHDTLYGVFPLVRFLAPSLFVNSQATGSYELIDDPDVVAVTGAAELLVTQVLDRWPGLPQGNTLFTSIPRNPALENEVRYIFNRSPKQSVMSRLDASRLLDSEELAGLNLAEKQEDSARILLQRSGLPELLLVTVKDRTVHGGNRLYLLEAKRIQPDTTGTVISVLGICRDRRSMLPIIAGIHLVFLFLALFLFFLAMRIQNGKTPKLVEFLPLALGAFLVGRIAPWILFPLLSAIAPQAETLALLSFWWPALIGLLIFFLFPLGLRILTFRLHSMIPSFDMEGKTVWTYASLALGVSSYLAIPSFLYADVKGFPFFALAALSIVILAMILGKTSDNEKSKSLFTLMIPVLISLALGLAVTSQNFPLISVLAVISMICLFFRSRTVMNPGSDHSAPPASTEETGPALPVTLEELAELAAKPPFIRLNLHAPLWSLSDNILDRKTHWIGLWGAAGRGKSASAQALIQDCMDRANAKGIHAEVISATCPEGTGEPEPFALFREALARQFGIDLLAPAPPQLGKIDLLLDHLFDSVVPFSGILFPPTGNETNSAQSKSEVFISIARTLEKLARKSSLIVFLDDLHWIDPASQDLLAFLHDHFPADGPTPIFFILASRQQEDFSRINIPVSSILELTKVNPEDQILLLTQSLGLTQETAERLTQIMSPFREISGELHWLFEMTAHFAREGCYEQTPDGFIWSERFKDGTQLPVPSQLRSLVLSQLKNNVQSRNLVLAAACIGYEFRASILADSMNLPVLSIIHQLSEIEENTDILFDVQEVDDLFRFRSPFVLEMIREELRIRSVEMGPTSRQVPQLIREYHGRIAMAMEKELQQNHGMIFDVANHYYAAGRKYCEKAMNHTLEAARSAAALFDYDSLHRYRSMARECAELMDKQSEIAARVLALNMDEAHIRQHQRSPVADQALFYLKTHPDCDPDLMVKIARTCFDAGAETRNQHYFQKAKEIGERLVKEGLSSIHKAEGLHFIGISLPVSEKEARKNALNEAYHTIADSETDDFTAQAIKARIANSLAEQLSYGSPEDKIRARELFEISLDIKNRPTFRDLPGLARSHGGLGRLHLYSDPPDVVRARKHFAQDLALSQQIGDLAGQCKMESLLGECDLREGHLSEAFDHYQMALNMSEDPFDWYFAAAGLLESTAPSGDPSRIDPVGEKILNRIRKTGIPGQSVLRRLQTILKTLPENHTATWSEELVRMVREGLNS